MASKLCPHRPQMLLLIVALISVSFLLLFVASSAEEGDARVKREWPWEWASKQVCKTAANCKCDGGKHWAKCLPATGYDASHCCKKDFVWSCCGKKPKH